MDDLDEAVEPATPLGNLGSVEDWDAEPEKPSGFLNNPAAKIGCGCLLPVLLAVSALGSKTLYGDGAATAGAAFGTTLLLAAPVYLFWLRDRSRWLRFGIPLAIFVLVLLFELGKLGQHGDRIREEVGVLNEMELTKDGTLQFAPGRAPTGELAQLIVRMASRQQEISKQLDNELLAAGLDRLHLAEKLAAKPDVLRRCDALLDLRGRFDVLRQDMIAVMDKAEAEADKLDLSQGERDGFKRGMRDAQVQSLRRIDRQLDIQRAMLQAQHQTCRILARRNWRARGETFEFSSASDLAAFNAQRSQLIALDGQMQAIIDEQIGELKRKQAAMKQSLQP